jgi:cytoskeletal protein RodZ
MNKKLLIVLLQLTVVALLWLTNVSYVKGNPVGGPTVSANDTASANKKAPESIHRRDNKTDAPIDSASTTKAAPETSNATKPSTGETLCLCLLLQGIVQDAFICTTRH